MSEKTFKKVGFFVALSMLLGSVVGIGIFFKNGSVGRAVEHNGTSWLLAWVFGGIISLAAAINFSEISFLKNTKIAGIGNWSHKVGDKRFGYFVSISFTLFYSGIIQIILGFFTAEIFFHWLNLLGANIKMEMWHSLVLGTVISFIFIILNIVSIKASGVFQVITTILKFLPLIATILVGLIFVSTHTLEDGANAFVPNKTKKIGEFSFANVIAALPAVLFAYDSFISVGSIGKRVKNSEKTLPKVVLFGMITIVILYSLVALSAILHNQGSIDGILKDSLSPSVSNAINTTVYSFLLISALGVSNGLIASYVQQIDFHIKSNTLAGAKKVLNYFKKSMSQHVAEMVSAFIYCFIMFVFWSLIILLPAMILNNDQTIDGASNMPTYYFFIIYGIVILLYTIKRVKNKLETSKRINNILFYTAAFFSLGGILVLTIISTYLIFADLFKSDFKSSWGVFLGGDGDLSALSQFFMYLGYLVLLIIIPIINWALKLWIDKENIVKDFDKFVEIEEVEKNQPLKQNY
ncbi:AMINO ACID PERMEASE [Mycoplasmopsis pulmonis]|uniref:AMINO ACID PERMEASE n=1 Tax=Mycoplasmopsis pulmonis (strain UAB CTIP) TaxID=272635 RepID=Q98QR4_MYCPU|nr:amino acid permease [Mycoplasmopsis pulmonis]MDZ7293256.1 amino acid permease [Mycoplasmopsis pulmonis]CAC13470.1 AMINO ACID PERMEASE [Mycoplasmopsis pulmonis]